jgi:hypothetical protein
MQDYALELLLIRFPSRLANTTNIGIKPMISQNHAPPLLLSSPQTISQYVPLTASHFPVLSAHRDLLLQAEESQMGQNRYHTINN